MNWRPLLAALIGLLLPLPLVLAIGAWRVRPEPQSMAQDPDPVSPILSIEERRALLTHERPCQKAEDCEPPLGCLDLAWGHSACMASECQTNLQCADGFICKALRTRGNGPWVRTCIVRGAAEEGSPCSPFFTVKPESACRPGLLCNGYCGRPCQPGEPGSCPEGTQCLKGSEGTSCMPTCEGKTCPAGEECARFNGGFSVCARIKGENCQRQSCPEGTRCSVAWFPGRQGLVEMECTRDCGEGHPSCPAGTLCEQGVCRQPCTSKGDPSCGPHTSCHFFPSKRWLCSP